MSNSSSSTTSSWSADASNLFQDEKQVFKTNVGLVLSTSVVTGVYSYFGIDGNTNNAINRMLLMALSTFISASIVNLLENNDYLDSTGMNARYVEASMIPIFYYGISKKQFAIPDINSQAVKTGVIASVVGELASTTAQKYVAPYLSTASTTGTVTATKSSSTTAVTK